MIDREGNVAALTSTVNLPFGAQFTANGIVMNDEMDDFLTTRGKPNAFGLLGGEANAIQPGKRPIANITGKPRAPARRARHSDQPPTAISSSSALALVASASPIGNASTA
mgnify:CR=1 FL=1